MSVFAILQMHLKMNKGGVTFFYKVKQTDSWKQFTFKLKCQKIVFTTSNVYIICQSDIIFILNPMSLIIHFIIHKYLLTITLMVIQWIV
jgi:hypothetical protein